MSDTTLRHLAMLGLIPAHPAKIAARDIHQRLLDEGYDVDVRSVERDLHKLSGMLALVQDDGRPSGWSWSNATRPPVVPAMASDTALTYELLSRFAAAVMPRALLRRLEPDFKRARQELARCLDHGYSRWARRIASVPQSHALLPPEIPENVVDVVYDSLLQGRQFKVDYRAPHKEKASSYVVNPLGLVQADSVLYVIVRIEGFDDARHLALHRMSKPERLDTPAKAPKGFDFDKHVREEKQFEYPVGDPIKLELVMEAMLARNLAERRLSTDQVITPLPGDEEVRITATVANTELLFRWLRSLGPNVEIVKPASLRRRMREEVVELAGRYRR
ncbi:MAG: WYL domain-containing protein [Lysobacterales bacterium]